MGIEENKEIILRQYEHYNRREIDEANELFAPEVNVNGRIITREHNKQTDIMLRDAFPDAKLTIVDIIAEGDKVAFIVNLTGTHTGGPLFGIPATGKKIDIKNTYIDRIADNKIVEGNGTADMSGVAQQLGIMHTWEEAMQAYKVAHNLE